MNTIKINPDNLERDYSSAEAYKTLRTNITFCDADKKVLLITSCTPNEGKSSVSLNLAVSLAESGKRVLLVDADLRKSVIMGKIEVSSETGEVYGLTHYLSKQAQVKDVICATDIKNLFVILPGPVPPNPTELLGNKYFTALINSLRAVYDYILIDSPPLGLVIDSAVIAKECDGSILVIESGVISYRFAQEVKSQLEMTGCPILGAVLNKVDIQHSKYYGKYYGKYGNDED